MQEKEFIEEEKLEEELNEDELVALQEFLKEYGQSVMVVDIESELDENEKSYEQFQSGIEDAMYYSGFYSTLSSSGIPDEIIADLIVLKAGFKMNANQKKDREEIKKEIIEKEFENY